MRAAAAYDRHIDNVDKGDIVELQQYCARARRIN